MAVFPETDRSVKSRIFSHRFPAIPYHFLKLIFYTLIKFYIP